MPFHSKGEFIAFLMALPTRRVVSMMQFHCVQDVRREWKINDLRDIAALATAIPYCDVVVTDSKAWDAAENRSRLGREFGTAIFRRMTRLTACFCSTGW
nr:hypothetical protein [Streptomyces sp. 846.5]